MLVKTEVSFEQWYHEVQCVKDHYPESVVWDSIYRSLKGAAVDLQYHGIIQHPDAELLQSYTR